MFGSVLAKVLWDTHPQTPARSPTQKCVPNLFETLSILVDLLLLQNCAKIFAQFLVGGRGCPVGTNICLLPGHKLKTQNC